MIEKVIARLALAKIVWDYKLSFNFLFLGTFIMTLIEVNSFYQAFMNGCLAVIKNKDDLNNINVFPVADKDTGSNLANTLSNVTANPVEFKNYKNLLTQISELTFMAARGNSGVIFAMFVESLAKQAKAIPSLTWHEFSDLVKGASNYLYDNIQPVTEGTIVTMVKAWGMSLSAHINANTNNAKAIVKNTLRDLKVVLNKTKEALPVLEKNQVVDAGAQAFFFFVEGFFQALEGKAITHMAIEPIQGESEAHDFVEKPNYRFCTEAIIYADKAEHKAVKGILEAQGDSHLCIEKDQAIRFHLHCDKPSDIFYKLINHGAIKQPKVEDMLRQYQASQKKSTIALVSDSTADLPKALLDKYQVHLLPINILLDESELLDNVSIKAKTLYEQLPKLKSYPQTSTPTLGVIKKQIEFLKVHYESIVIITISSKLSGTFKAVQQVIKNDKDIHLIDSKQNTGAHGLLLEYAGELILKQKPIDEVLKEVKRKVEKTDIWVAVNDFSAMIKSGRLSPMKGLLARLSHVKPIVSTDKSGNACVITKSFTHQRALQKIINFVRKAKNNGGISKYCVLHVNDKESATAFAQMVEQELGYPPLFIKNVSPAVGLHAGKGALAVAIIRK